MLSLVLGIIFGAVLIYQIGKLAGQIEILESINQDLRDSKSWEEFAEKISKKS